LTIFEELNDLVAETPAGKVIFIYILILLFSAAVAGGFLYWVLHHRH
jgi:hypothetical protein